MKIITINLFLFSMLFGTSVIASTANNDDVRSKVQSSVPAFSNTGLVGRNHVHLPNSGHFCDIDSHNSTDAVPASEAAAELNAINIVASLVQRNKIDKSWSSVGASAIKKNKFDKREEWVVSFKNKKIDNIYKQNLHVFLTISGEYIAVNYTGE